MLFQFLHVSFFVFLRLISSFLFFFGLFLFLFHSSACCFLSMIIFIFFLNKPTFLFKWSLHHFHVLLCLQCMQACFDIDICRDFPAFSLFFLSCNNPFSPFYPSCIFSFLPTMFTACFCTSFFVSVFPLYLHQKAFLLVHWLKHLLVTHHWFLLKPIMTCSNILFQFYSSSFCFPVFPIYTTIFFIPFLPAFVFFSLVAQPVPCSSMYSTWCSQICFS